MLKSIILTNPVKWIKILYSLKTAYPPQEQKCNKLSNLPLIIIISSPFTLRVRHLTKTTQFQIVT